MKIAVCVSGSFNTKRSDGCLINNNKLIKSKFPGADFYYATWDSYKPKFEKLFPQDKCEYYSEPDMHYHPYTDIEKKNYISKYYEQTVIWVKSGNTERLQWTSHHTKQILIHSWLIDKIKEDYDIIVRARFDSFISKNADFSKYLDDTFKNNRANCFGATKWKLFDNLREMNTVKHGGKQKNWIVDQLIIHNSDAIDTNNVNLLHEQKKLHAAEYGWYQVISMPHGSNHQNHSGWVNPDWSIMDEFYSKGNI